MKKNSEYAKFDALASELLKVPHDTVKRKIAAEKSAKKRKKKDNDKQDDYKH